MRPLQHQVCPIDVQPVVPCNRPRGGVSITIRSDVMQEEEVEILIVEDDPNDLELELQALQDAGISRGIEVARDGEKALDFLFCRNEFRQRHPDCQPKLILLDLKLPKVNGLGVLREIKADLRTRMLPLVILTSSKQEQDVIQSYQLGANSYVQKPVNFDAFCAAIRQLGNYWLLTNQAPYPRLGPGEWSQTL
jgi:two-component system, response regulator